MSILLAVTGRERAGLRVLALFISLACLFMAAMAARPELVLLHFTISALHITHLSGGLSSLPSLPAALS